MTELPWGRFCSHPETWLDARWTVGGYTVPTSATSISLERAIVMQMSAQGAPDQIFEVANGFKATKMLYGVNEAGVFAPWRTAPRRWGNRR